VTCGASTCAGCCAGNFCLDLNLGSSFACGAKGEACKQCPNTQVCTNGSCVPDSKPSIDGGIGAACLFDGQCKPPVAGLCIPESVLGVPTGWPGGYCTLGCNNNGTCPGNSICINVASDGGTDNLCLASCRAPRRGQSSCRSGYLCEVSGPSIGTGMCVPRCENAGFTCYPNTVCDAKSGYCVAKR